MLNDKLWRWITYYVTVERENSWPITSWHIILLRPQSTKILELHVLQLVYTITIQKITKICQVPWNKNIKSMQNVNHTSAHVSNDVSSSIRVSNDTCHTSTCVSNDIGACKRWHKWSNQLLTCVTLKIKIFQPIKWCHVSWRKSLKNPPIIL